MPVEPKIDLFALIMLLGITQGLFMSIFFLISKNRKTPSNLFLGFFLLAVSLLGIDIFLSYTHYMFNVLFLVDTTEPIALLIGPAFYLYITSKFKSRSFKKTFYHFVPAILYAIYYLPIIFQGENYSFNSYITAYNIDLPYREAAVRSDFDFLNLQEYINEFVLLSLGFYSVISLVAFVKNRSIIPKENQRRIFLESTFFILFFILVLIIKVIFDLDLGDHLIISLNTIAIYYFSFVVIKESHFFIVSREVKKYEKSVLDDKIKTAILQKLEVQIEGKFYISPSVTLPELASKVETSPNYLSQVINEKLGLSFFELLAKNRIEEAKKILADQPHKTIEEIAYEVGYNSKSAFNNAFKKFTNQTPSQFKNGL